MTFPDELPLGVEAYLGDVAGWVDLSGRLLGDVRIKRGAADGSATVAAGSATVVLDDDDGALTPLNPAGVYYPHVRRGAPARIAVRRALDTFDRTVTGAWGTADSGQTWALAGGSTSDYAVSGGVATMSHAVTDEIRRAAIGDLLDVEQVTDISVPEAVTGAAMVCGHVARLQSSGDYYWLRLEFNAGGTTTLKISKQVPAGFIELADLTDVPGLTYAPGQPLRIRSLVYGRYLAVKAWHPDDPEPRDWMLSAVDTDIAAPGAHGCQTWLVGGNSNTLPVAISHSDYAARVGRFAGEIASLRADVVPRTDGTLVNATSIQVAGVLRRLGQGTPPTYSALRWDIASPEHAGLIDYWPLEDGDDAGSAAPAVLGGTALTASGTVAFGSYRPDLAPGLLPLPDLSQGGSLSGPVQQTGTSSPVAWTVQWVGRQANSDVASAAYMPISWTTSDGATWEILLTGSPNNNTALRRNGTVIIEDGTAFVSDFEWRVTAIQSGADILVQLIIDGATQGDVTPGGAGPWTASVAGTLGWPVTITGNPAGAITAPAVHGLGHIQVWDGIDPPSFRLQFFTDSYGGLVGNSWWAHQWETAVDRLARVAEQAQIPVIDVPAPTGPPTRTGFQAAADGLTLIAETVAADLGLLAEARDVSALLPHLRETLYNRPVRLTVDMSTYRTTAGTSGQVLAPVYDDQRLRNDVTVRRVGGSWARAVDETSIADVGRYDAEEELNVGRDNPLPDIASWLVRVGTVDEARHPSMLVDLGANPDLIDAWLAVDVGSRVQRTNVPPPYGGTIDQIVDGYTEVIGPRRWTVSAVCSPASPWTVGVLGVTTRLSPRSRTAADFIAGGDTTLVVERTDPGTQLWITTAGRPGDFPFDILVAGIRLRVTAITGTGDPQTLTVDPEPVNGLFGIIVPAGEPVTLAEPWRLAL